MHRARKTARAYWSRADHEKLEALAKAGAFAREIATATGRTRNAVISRANRTGVALLQGTWA
jgi:hypothetical protein